ncbi:MAG: DUF1640 domain-containing protein [Pseudomonadota bacterium]
MATITFDTLKFAQTLRAAGVSESQAEAFAEAVRESHLSAEVATKADIELLRAEIRKDIADSRAELTRWIVSVGILQSALIAALVIKLIA